MSTFYRFIQTLVLAVIFSSIAFAQNPIPNPGFENWTQGNPDNWATSNIPGFYVPITQSTSSHSGTYAVKGIVLQDVDGNYPPILFSFNQQFSISQSYTRMTGYYQMTNFGEDALYVEVLFYDAQSNFVAEGGAELGATTGGYQMFSVEMDYTYGSQQPVTGAYIYFLIELSSSSQLNDITVGSSFLLDDLAFDMVSALNNQADATTPLVFALEQNYPNPFNPATTIGFSLPSAEKTGLTIYNTLGQAVKTLINENLPAGIHQASFDAAGLPSGIYYYKLEAGSFQSVKKMMLVK